MFTDLPTFIETDNLDNYNQQLSQMLCDWFRSSGFFLPTLTNAEVVSLLALNPAITPPRIWFNSDSGKVQILTLTGTVETVTSV